MPQILMLCWLVLKQQIAEKIFSTQDFLNPQAKHFLPPDLTESNVGNKNQTHLFSMFRKYGEPLPDTIKANQSKHGLKCAIEFYSSLWADIVSKSKVGSCLPLSCWGLKKILSIPQQLKFRVIMAHLKHYDHYILIISHTNTPISDTSPGQWPSDAYILDLYTRQTYPANQFCLNMQLLVSSNVIFPYLNDNKTKSFEIKTIFDSTKNNALPDIDEEKVNEIISANSLCQRIRFFTSHSSQTTKLILGAATVAACGLLFNSFT